jgi:hypothetical protein
MGVIEMTSANVTYYHIYRNGKLVLNESQHHYCKNTIDEILFGIVNPEECVLEVIWLDEDEVDQTQYHGSLKKFLDRKTAKAASLKAELKTWNNARQICGKCASIETVRAKAKELDMNK